jgi:uncharacterized membrane protein
MTVTLAVVLVVAALVVGIVAAVLQSARWAAVGVVLLALAALLPTFD